jgi:uncharacterized membrane protein YidH (DUF202 family)
MKKYLAMIVFTTVAFTATAQWQDNGRQIRQGSNFQQATLVIASFYKSHGICNTR